MQEIAFQDFLRVHAPRPHSLTPHVNITNVYYAALDLGLIALLAA